MTQSDVIDTILGAKSAASVASLRASKPELAVQMQAYSDAVFIPAPDSARQLSPSERCLIAIRTASHSRSAPIVDWYEARARESGAEETSIAKAKMVSDPWNGDRRSTAIMRHVDLIVTRPVDSSQEDMSALLDAGLTPGGIVALSQVVAYVSYQIRLIATLRALGENA